jgi:hypothetical protein
MYSIAGATLEQDATDEEYSPIHSYNLKDY